MKTFLIICGCLTTFFVVYDRLTSKYVNDYDLTCYFGKKGSGKTSRIAQLSTKYLKQGYSCCYSSCYVKGCELFDPNDLKDFMPLPNSVIFIDEIGLVFNSRQYRNFDKQLIEFFKLSRHYQCKIICFSQVYDDSDKVIRNLFDKLYIVTCIGRVFSVARPIKKIMTISNTLTNNDDDKSNNGGKIIDTFKFSGLPSIIFIPRWIPFFDSYDITIKEILHTKTIPLDTLCSISTKNNYYFVVLGTKLKKGYYLLTNKCKFLINKYFNKQINYIRFDKLENKFLEVNNGNQYTLKDLNELINENPNQYY